jgi:mono/diheme cytochrome c family protein
MLRIALLTVLGAAALALSACAAAGPTVGASTADLGNAALGLAYAEQTCASCHAIGAGEMRSPDPRARPFDAIANTPGLTSTALNAWLHSSHTNMPNLIVTSDESDDLYAYLFTLKRRN